MTHFVKFACNVIGSFEALNPAGAVEKKHDCDEIHLLGANVEVVS